jgi:type IV pilus assembly protein PilF
LRYYRTISLSTVILFMSLLAACVTTTTGGFNVDTSREQAQEDYIQLALAYYDADDTTGARRHINNALRLGDRNSRIYNVMALIYQREGDLGLAEENFERAISLDRENSRARNNYAALLFSMERYREAYEQLQRVTQDTTYEGRAIAFENLGRSALRLGRIDDAEAAFERGLQLNANLYVTALELAIIKADEENWPEARRNFQRYLTIVSFFNIPHTPRALLAGIQIEGKFQNASAVQDYTLILTTLYQDSPEYLLYQRTLNAN